MGFIGNNLGNVLTEAKTIDTIVGDGVNTTLTISTTPGSVNNVEVYYDGIFQSPSEDFTLLGNILTFTSAPPLGVAVVVLSGNDSQVVYPESNTISSAKILDNVIESSKINDIAVEKVSGILPALNGEAITGLNIPAAVDVTTSSANPTVTENKPLGSLWVNSTTGDMFIETDATVDQNTWTNIGVGEDNIQPLPFGGLGGGTVSGYTVGGNAGAADIEVFSIPSDTGSTYVGSLTIGRNSHAGHSSTTHGYISGGAVPPFQTNIERFAFASPSTSADWSDLQVAVNAPIGSMNQTHGYTCGGTPNYPTPSNYIDKFSFSSQATASSHGVLARSVFWCGSMASYTDIYVAGSWTNLSGSNGVDKFAFASNTTATTVFSLASNKSHPAGYSNITDGYIAGGHNGSASTGTIDKISFASDTITNGHGNLNTARQSAGSVSSTTAGYVAAGSGLNGVMNNREKYTFSNESTTSGLGGLTQAKHSPTGNQY
jgi:hypothetical protein